MGPSTSQWTDRRPSLSRARRKRVRQCSTRDQFVSIANHNGTDQLRAMTTQVTIVPYDPDWRRRFDEERSVLAAVLAGSDAIIEHVGSTAVPGLGAKPVIDILIGVPILLEVEDRIS